MKRIFLLALLAQPLFLHAQEQQVVKQLPMKTYTVNLQKNVNSFRSVSVAQTRATVSVPLGYRWIDRIFNLPDYWLSFYLKYDKAVEESMEGRETWLTNPEKGEKLQDGMYAIKLTTFTGKLTSAEAGTLNAVISKQWDEVCGFFDYISQSLSYDNPQVFWIGSSSSLGNQCPYTIDSKGNIEYTHSIYYVLKNEESDFDIRRPEYYKEGKIADNLAVFNESIDGILSGIPEGADRFETVSYLNEWLTNNNYYNPYLSSGASSYLAWSPLSALQGLEGTDAPVCEGYARAFKVLCDRLEIPCVLAVGLAKGKASDPGESHMWNEIEMNDHKWYAVDVTWNDPVAKGEDLQKVSGHESDKWLLLGSETEVSDNYTFAESHPNSLGLNIDEKYLELWQYNITSLLTAEKYDHEAAGNDQDPDDSQDPDDNQEAGIDSVIMGADAQAGIYTLCGTRVREVTQGLYIIRKNGQSQKVLVQ